MFFAILQFLASGILRNTV